MAVPARALEAIEASDHDELLRVVDGLCAARDWDGLVELRTYCQEAVTRGKQVWAIDEHIRYRLALEAPAPWAGPVVTEGPARFTLGPLTEVVAQHHTWAELDPHLEPGPARAAVAHERVVRGEDLTGADVDLGVFELPLRLQRWEPRYPVAEYHSDRAEFPRPDPPPLQRLDLPEEAASGEPDDAAEALADLVRVWVEESNGRATVATVEGTASQAIRAIGVRRAWGAALRPGDAFAQMAWAGASGGAHGRRRGMAAGRYAAWWAATELAGLDWPPDLDQLGDALEELRWTIWSDGPQVGWVLRLAVEDPVHGLAWAIAADDAV